MRPWMMALAALYALAFRDRSTALSEEFRKLSPPHTVRTLVGRRYHVAHVLCDQRLWRIGRAWLFAHSGRPSNDSSILSAWTATRLHDDDFDLVITVNAATLFPRRAP